MKFSFLARLVLLALAFQFIFAGGGCGSSSGSDVQGTTSFPIHLINRTPMQATFNFPGDSAGGVPVAGNGGMVNRAVSISHLSSDIILRVSVFNANNETGTQTITITNGDLNGHVEVTATWDADVLTLTKHTI